jgi:hypothetical protein
MTEGRDPDTQQFTAGNRFWERSLNAWGKLGVMPTFTHPEDLLAACIKYFEDITENPLLEEKTFSSDGEILTHDSPKMRAMTIKGLCNSLGVVERRWRDWRANRTDLKDVIEFVEQIIYQQKFEGAAAGLLNHAIIARDLGLADKTSVTADILLTDAPMSKTEKARRLLFMLAEAQNEAKQEKSDG